MKKADDKPWTPQWYWDTSSGMDIATRSVMPRKRNIIPRKAIGADWRSKERS